MVRNSRRRTPVIPMTFELGKLYYISYPNGRMSHSRMKFIKVTKLGYNFLNVETNECIFKSHFYVPKKWLGQLKFLIPTMFIIKGV